MMDEDQRSDDPGECVVVGVGASAGGVAAYKRLLEHMPDDRGLAFVLVLHLDPAQESLMVGLLARQTCMPVTQVEDGVALEPNHVYVIPPAKFVRLEGDRLRLEEPVVERGLRLPIDFLFRSLADERGERAIGIVLSGTGSDGSEGVRAIKAAGGMTIVEAPDEAEHKAMPLAALSTGTVDHALRIEEMAEVVLPYARHPYVRTGSEVSLAERAPDQYRTILDILKNEGYQDFTQYKSGTVTRRIQRRMGIRQVEDAGAYLRLLRSDPHEVRALRQDMLIGVTHFFRDPKSWEELDRFLAQRLLEKGAAGSFRVWVPGCSTGEEAYSVAILLCEQLGRLGRRVDVQIFATDVDGSAIDVARAGSYPLTVAENLSDERIDRFFDREGDTLRVCKGLREACVFAIQDVLTDPPFSRLDLVSCRNLLIYLRPEFQSRVLDLFHFSLVNGGVLFLGSSESPAKAQPLFATHSQAARIYMKQGSSPPGTGGAPVSKEHGVRMSPTTSSPVARVSRRFGPLEVARTALLDDFAPASVVVTQGGVIQYIHGPVRDYLDFPTGAPELQIGSMVVHGLKAKTRAVLSRVRSSSEPVAIVAPRVRRDGRHVSVRIRARRLPRTGEEPLYLVSFQDLAASPGEEDGDGSVGASEIELADGAEDSDRDLALELEATREDLQSTIEELESANEELKASNEEVMSMNEELQIANEELETSREELQSLNEELSTVNSQLHDKVVELEDMTDDLTNLLTSTDLATLFLDAGLRIRRFTPASERLMSLRDADVGRPIVELASRVDDPQLAEDAARVLEDLVPVARKVSSSDGRYFMRRVTPFRTSNNKIAGVAVTYTDVSTLEEASRRVAYRERQQAVTAQLGRAALAGTDLQTVLERAVREIADTLDADFAKVLRLEPDGERLGLVAGVGWDEGLVGHAFVPAGMDSQAGYTLRSAGPVIVSDLGTERRFSGPALLSDHGVVSGMSVIIGPEDDPWGVLGVHAKRAIEFTLDDTHFINAIANLLWESIRRSSIEARVRQQLAELRGIYDSAPIGLCFLDRELRFVRANERLADINGRSVDQHLGRTLREVVPHLADTLEPILKRVIETGEPELEVEFRSRGTTNGGEERTWLASYAPIFFDGEIAGINAAAKDITARQHMEEAIHEARSAAEAANHAKSQFLANMSHEIRSPLTAILGFAEVLYATLDGAKPRSLVNLIKSNGDHLCQILDDILDLAKVESGTLRVHVEACEISPLLSQIRSLMGARAAAQGLSLTLASNGPVPRTIRTDARMVRQILLNLVGNALKFTEEGGIRIIVEAWPDQERLAISVTDSGQGIEPDRFESIFRPFEQGDVSSTRSAGGTGLGLAITKRLVEALEAEITVESEVGVGSTFTFTIGTGPLADVELIELAASPLTETDGGFTLSELPRLVGRVLAVEDRTDIQILVREFLESVGCEVITASDGAEALSLWSAAGTLDAVLMDIQMPLMDGLEASRKLREEGYEGPIIALTAGVMGEDRQRSLDAGCDDFISKPIDPAELVHTLARWMAADAEDGSHSILYVEDHEEAAEATKLVLEARGHRVTVASTAAKAFEALEYFTPDAVLVDMGLPDLSGGELLRRLRGREDLSGCRFVCLSGRSEREIDWREIGFDGFLRKPSSAGEIEQAIG
jgi:two-component system, chemotaxis family, CheB/CheR fusion protein